MPNKTEITKILAALGNLTRLALVEQLSMAETFAGQSISELAESSGITRQAVTKHLEVLAEAGLVSRLKPGRATWYELKVEPLKAAIEALTSVANQHQRSQQRLKKFAREVKNGAGLLSGRKKA